MKKLLLLFFMFVLAMTAVAQHTQKITYQAVVRDAANRLVVYTPVRVDATITYSSGSYFESLRDTTNANGLMSVEIGGNPGFENIDWTEAVIKTVITIDGGETVTDEVTVTAVPYALTASYSLNVNPTAPTIVAIYNQMQADSLALANQIAAERAHLDDTLSHYLMQEVQVLRISNDTIYLTGGSFVKLPAGFSGDYNDLTHLPDLSQYATNVHLNDTLGHYPTLQTLNDTLSHYLMQEVQVLSVSNDTLYLTGGSWVKLPQGFSGDYNDLTNRPDLNQYVTNVHMNDTLGYYLKEGDLCDSIVKCDIFQNMRDSIQINATNIANHTTSITNNTTNITNNTTNINNITNNIASLQVVDSTLEARITADSTNLANNYYNKDEINDTLSHYLMEEVQVLSISNDTIYLTGGSFVKLPAGFSGDYNDLTNRPTNVSAFNNDAGYLTSYTEVQALSISNDTIYLTGGSFVKLPAGFSGDYNELINKPNLDQYVTNTHLNDTLGHYYTNTEINDTLAHYLRVGDLCDSIVKCGVIQDMRDSIQINATNITHVQTDINNITGNIISLLNVDSILAAQIISDSVLFYKTDSILLARILNDSTNLANNYYNKDEINDTLSHYLMQEVQVLSISNDTIYLTGGSFVKLPAGFSGDYNDLTNRPTNVSAFNNDAGYLTSYTEVQALSISNDTIYLTGGSFVKLPAGFSGDYNDLTNRPTNVSAFNNDAGYLTSYTEVQALSISNDTIYLTGGSFVKLPAGFSGDYNELINRPNLDQYVTNTHLNDTLGHYYTNTEINDTLAHYLRAGDLCDSIVKCGVIQDMRDSIQINTTNISNNTTNITNITNNITTITTDLHAVDSILNARITTDSTALANRIHTDSTVLATRMDTLLKHVCDSVKPCVTGWISDSTRMVFDTLHNRYTTLTTLSDSLSRYATLKTLNDTLSHYLMQEVQVLSVSNDTLYLTGGSWVKLPQGFSGDYNDLTNAPTNVSAFNNDAGYLTSDSAVIVNLNTNVANLQGDVTNLQNADNVLSSRITADSAVLANRIVADSTVLATRMDTLLKHVCDSVQECVTGWISDSTRMVFDTLHGRYTTLKTLNDTLSRYTTTNQIDTLIKKYGYLTSDSAVIVMMRDSIQKVNAHVSADSLILAQRIHTDSVVVMDTLHKYYATKDTLKNFVKKDALCTEVMACDDIQTMRDSIQKVNAHVSADSLILAQRIHTDSVVVMDTLHKYYATKDTLKNYYTRYQVDTAKTNIRNEIQNGTLTITYGSTVTTFTANQATGNDVAVTIPTPAEQVQADWNETDALKTSFIRNKPNIRDSVNRVVLDSLYAANSAMNKAIDTIARNNIRDSLAVVREKIYTDSTVLATRIHKDSLTMASRMDTLLKHVCDSVKPCVTGWMNDTLKAYTTTNKIDTLIQKYGYATNAHLNDTLGKYTTTNQIDTLIRKYGYLTSDSAVIVMMRDSIQKVNAHVSADSLVLANRIVADSTALAHRMDTLLKHVCDSVKPCVTSWISDSTRIVFDTLHRYYATNDTLKNYYTRYQVDTAKANIRNEIQNGTLTITYGSTVTTFTANQATGNDVAVTIPTPEEQVQADWNETDVLKTSFIRNKPNIRDSVNRVVLDSLYAANSAMNKAIDTIARNNIHDSLTVVREMIHADSTVLATRMDTLLKHVCDSVQECVTNWMNDTLKAYTTTNKIDTLIQKYGFATNAHLNDTLRRYTTTNQIDTLLNAYEKRADLCKDVIGCIGDTLSKYTTTNQIDTLIKKYGYLTSDSAVIVMMRDSIQKVNAHVSADSMVLANRIVADSTALAHRMDTLLKHVCDSVQECVTGWMNDTLKAYTTTNKIDTLIQKYGYATTAHLNDTLGKYTTTNQIDTLIRKYGYLTSDSAVIVMMRDSIQKVNAHVSADSLVLANRIVADSTALAHRMDTLLKHVCDSVKPCVTGWISDSTRMVFDTLHTRYTTLKTLNDTLRRYTTTNQIDTLISKYGYLTSDSAVIVMMRDSIQKVNAHVSVDSLVLANRIHNDSLALVNRIVVDSTALAHRMDTLLKHVCDSVKPCVTGWISDSTRMVFDTLHTHYTTLKTLADSMHRVDVRIKHDSLEVVALYQQAQNALTALALKDKIDSALLANRIHNDSMALVNRIVTDSTALAHRMDTLLKHVCDSVKPCVTGWMNDTLKAYTTTNKIDTLIQKYGYATTAHLNDTLRRYTTTNQIDTLLNAYEKRADLCKDVIGCIGDTLSKYTSTNQIDTLIRKYGYLTSDSAVIMMMRDSIQKVNDRLTYDSTKLADRIYADSIDLAKHISDTASAIRNSLGDTINHYIGKADLVIMQGVNTLGTFNANQTGTTVTVEIPTPAVQAQSNWTETNTESASFIQNKPDLNVYATKDALRDSTRMVYDSLHRYYATKDTLKNFVKKDALCTEVMACDDIQTMRDSIQKVNAHVSADSLILANRIVTDSTALAHRMDTLLKHVCDSVKPCVTDWMNDTLKAYTTTNKIDTLIQKYGYATTSHLNDTLRHYTTTNQIDTLISKYGYLTSDSAVIVMMRDSIQKVNAHVSSDSLVLANRIVADSTALVHRMDTLLKHVCDSVKPCVTSWISDSTRMVFDTLHKYYTNLSTLADSMHKVDVRIKHDSLEVVELYKQAQTALQTLALTEKTDSLTLAHRMDTLLKHVCDSVKPCVTSWISDSTRMVFDTLHSRYTTLKTLKDSTTAIRGALVDTARNIRNSIVNADWNATEGTAQILNKPEIPTVNDATLTIQKNGTTVGTFTANQATDNTINITVPTCDSLAECDLIKSILARLDKLERQNDSLAKELEKMKPNLTVAAKESVTVCSGSTLPVTYTATFHNCSSSDYTLAWKVNDTDSSAVTGAVLTLNVEEEGSYKVVCIATRSDNTFVTDTVTTHVAVDTHVPYFTASVNGLTVTLSDVANTATIQWDTDSAIVEYNDATHTYSVADTITITATSENGCTFTKGLRLKAIAPTVTTDSIKSVAATTAKAYGTVTSDGGIPETKRGMVYSTSDQNLELGADGVDTAMNGTGMGSYSCNLNRLVPCTQYYVRAFAFNEVDTVYGEVKNFTTLPFTCGSTLTDIDGNEYGTRLLGSQCWMQQNLRTTHFADGTEIPVGGLGLANQTGARRYAPDNNLNTYGYLYNWDAAMNGNASSSANPSGVQGVCPDGWHLPSDAEWTQLTTFVASNSDNVCDNNPSYIAKSLVSTEDWGAGAWSACSSVTTNNTGFSVLPAGTWHVNAALGHVNQGYAVGMAIFRTATGYEGNYVWTREFYTENPYVDATAIDKTNGLSVRCVLTCPTESAYLPTVSVVSLSRTGTTVSMTGNVLSDGGATVTERGVCWSTSQHPTTSSTHKAASSAGTGSFTVSEDLTPGETYYVRAYAINSEGTAYGAEVTYVVPNPKYPPTVNTGSKFLALAQGFEDLSTLSEWETIDNDGDGKNWIISSNYNAHNGSSRCAASASWEYDFDLEQELYLQPDNYLITPDITLPSGISPILTFWYRGSDNYLNWAKERLLVNVGNAGASTADDFNTNVFDSISSNEYVQKTVDLSSYAGHTIRLAFIHNQTTSMNHLLIDDIVIGVAGAGANIVSDVTATTATCGGYVSDDGGATVTARGVCWSTSQNPTISDSHTTDGSGTGSFTSNITGLNALTTYYVRAYATNSEGTTYGNQVSFTTPEALPKVNTSAVSDITVVSGSINAKCGGNVTDIGAYDVAARGVCWSTSSNPTIADNHTTDGSGLGSFTSSITGLTSGATYYVRAYATNNAGTAYGNQVTLTLPVVDTKSCTSAPVVVDHEGNAYATVQIGTQCWMRENLRTTTSPKTGTKVALPARNSAGNVYSSYGSKVAHWYACDETTYAPKGYGLLYNWCAAMDTANSENYMEIPTSSNINGNNNQFDPSVTDPYRGICPEGWHIPSLTELNGLINNYKAGMLADGNDWSDNSSTSTTNTSPGNYNYTDRNSTGFTAFPAGFFNNYNSQSSGQEAHFWSTWQMNGENNATNSAARAMKLLYSGSSPILVTQEKNKGLSVRCIKD